jgi:glycogen(starch) synthase
MQGEEYLNIAFVSIEFPPRIFGGLGTYVTSISAKFVETGHMVWIFTPNNSGELPSKEAVNNIEIYRPQSVSCVDTFRHFTSPETLNRWGEGGIDFLCDLLSYNHLSAYLLEDLIDKNPIDICIAHDWLGLPAALSVKKDTGIPTIYHIHSTEAGRSLGSPNPQLVSYELLGIHLVDAVITVSHAMKDELITMGADPKKIHVCYNGIDAGTFDPSVIEKRRLSLIREQYSLTPDDAVILFLGRLEPVKGADKLVQAMPRVIESNPNARLVMVGSGTQEGLIRDMITQYHIEDQVFVNTGFLDDVSKIHHYAMADVCVFPSLYEPFGIVALEAMAMERPIVVGARGVSGLREIVVPPSSNRPTGMHVNPSDPEDIAWGINTVLSDPEAAKIWGQNGRKRVLDTFTWDIIGANTINIYEGTINV